MSILLALAFISVLTWIDVRGRNRDRAARLQAITLVAADRDAQREALALHARAELARSEADLAMAEAGVGKALVEVDERDAIDLMEFDNSTGEQRPGYLRKIEW